MSLWRDLHRVVRETAGFRTAILAALTRIERKMETIMADLSELTAEVQENTSVTGSVITLLEGLDTKLADLQAQLEAAGTDASAVQALRDELSANNDALAAAVSARTPAEEPPAEPEPA